MGREIRRVPLDFEWPLQKVWQGFLNPHYDHARECPFCEGSGYNAATKKLADDFYDSDNCDVYGLGRAGMWSYTRDEKGWPTGVVGPTTRWCDKITQEEVDFLLSKGRLRTWRDGAWHADPRTAEDVNRENAPGARGVMGHDAINRHFLIEFRGKKLGIYGFCEHCDDGTLWRTPADKEAAEAWERTPPPEGPGYQLWETTSEGSPLSPVFATSDELVRHLVVEMGWDVRGLKEWVEKVGWSPTLIARMPA